MSDISEERYAYLRFLKIWDRVIKNEQGQLNFDEWYRRIVCQKKWYNKSNGFIKLHLHDEFVDVLSTYADSGYLGNHTPLYDSRGKRVQNGDIILSGGMKHILLNSDDASCQLGSKVVKLERNGRCLTNATIFLEL